jgi:hypothetical protein
LLERGKINPVRDFLSLEIKNAAITACRLHIVYEILVDTARNLRTLIMVPFVPDHSLLANLCAGHDFIGLTFI